MYSSTCMKSFGVFPKVFTKLYVSAIQINESTNNDGCREMGRYGGGSCGGGEE